MKIVIAGASTYGVKNHGDDAMFKVLCDGIKKKYPKCNLIFLARHPNKIFDNEFGVKSIKNIEHNSKKDSMGKWFYGFNPNDSTEHFKKIRHTFENADLIILGGNSFMEISSNEFMRGVSSYSAFFATLAKIYEKPFVLYGVNGHPLKNEFTKQMARYLCNNAQLVTIRESFFQKELIKIGVNQKKLKVFTDPVFGLEPITTKTSGKKVLEKEKIYPKTSKLIGICFRHMYWMWNDVQFEHYSKMMAKICDFVIEKFNSDVLFIPNCTYNEAHKFQDDRVVSNYILTKMKHSKNAHMIKNDLSLKDILSVYPLFDLVISNRRHASIFAAIHSIPFMVLSTGTMWHHEPFMNMLSSKHLVDMKKTNLVEIKKHLENMWKNSEKISIQLNKKIPLLRKEARKQVEVLTTAEKLK
jgi:colanic acid/amylovoran biosynthesis protein